MTLPDYESAWTDIASSKTSASSYKEFAHKLGEVPILVDVQVMAIDGPNKGYIFQASGGYLHSRWMYIIQFTNVSINMEFTDPILYHIFKNVLFSVLTIVYLPF
ncbi:hypothetical protein DPMN_056355 [Dreissena polymorpha]|uniref:Uncharacterized protein n=1 Tax=Dreissena polymorpha TaxID=45954 RepID=A0A9D4CU94_DREPO|nr:hypothetical protein DPMN_056355 [Dreissena polymorpha]